MTLSNGLGDPPLLAEESNSADLVGVDPEIKTVRAALRSLIQEGRNSIIAYIGPFGAGKTTVLNAVKSDTATQYNWATFETWRYANRDDLWSNFTVEIVARFNKMPLARAAEMVDGNVPSKWEKTIGVLLFAAIIITSLTSHFIWSQFKGDPFVTAWLKYALPTFISALGFIGLSALFSWPRWLRRTNQLNRVFQFEEVLRKSLGKSKLPTVIVVDDADRAGEDGLVFLETLRTFVKNNSFPQPVVIIAPQNRSSMPSRTLKIYDMSLYFSPDISKYDFAAYYQKLGIGEEHIQHLTRISEIFASDYRDQISLRLYKYALREARQFLLSNPDGDLSIAFIFALSRHITISTRDERVTIAEIIWRGPTDYVDLLPFLVALSDKERKWKPGETYEWNIGFREDAKEINVTANGKHARIIVNTRYKRFIDFMNAEQTW